MSAFNVKKLKNETDRIVQPALPAGMYPARLIQVVLLGMQPQSFQGVAKEPKMSMRLVYELLDEFMVDEEGNETEDPRWVGETITLNPLDNDNANSTKRYYALDPECDFEGDFSKLVGLPVMVNLSKTQGKRDNSDRYFNNVKGLAAPRPKEAEKMPEAKGTPLVWDFYTPDVDVFMSFPMFLREIIQKATDYEGSMLEKLVDAWVPSEEEEQPKEEKKAPKKKKAEPVEEDEEDGEDW